MKRPTKRSSVVALFIVLLGQALAPPLRAEEASRRDVPSNGSGSATESPRVESNPKAPPEPPARATPQAPSAETEPAEPRTVEPSRAEVEGALRPNTRALEPSSPEAIELARRHFETALGHYRSGDYERAVRELERALTLDPEGKDLVYNLALLFEKLGKLDRAIQYFQRFAQMETDQEELSRVYAMIRRLRGARAIQQARRERRAVPLRPDTRTVSEPDARVDGWFWAASGVAVAATIVGGVFGVRALSENPGPEDRTGAGTTFNALRDRRATAHQSAVIADVAFLVALASAGTAGVLYFGRGEAKTSAGRTWRVEF